MQPAKSLKYMKKLPKSYHVNSSLLHPTITNKPFSSIPIINQPTNQNDPKFSNSNIPISKIPQSSNLYSQSHIINTLLKLKNQPLSALEYYESVGKQQGYDGNFVSLCVLIHILMDFNVNRQVLRNLVCSEEFPNGETLIKCLNENRDEFSFVVDSRVLNFLLYGYCIASRVDDGIFCVEWMVENGFEVRVLNINLLLNVLVKKSMIKVAWELYNGLCDRGIVVDSETIRTMMKACLKEGKPCQAERVFRKARVMGVELDSGAYSCAVGVVRRKGNANVACELLREMKEKGWVPSQGTFTQGILACVEGRNMVEALRLRDEMIACGRGMNVVVTTALMKGYCVLGDLESALRLFERMSEDGVSPNKVTFAVLIDGCCSLGKIEKGFEIYEEIIRMGIEPSSYNVNSLIKGFLNANSLDRAYEQFNKGIASGLVDVASYNILLSWLCRNNKVCEAKQLWDKMVKYGIKPTLVSYNHLLLGYCREGNIVLANTLYVEMLAKGFKPNAITFNILLDASFKKDEVEKSLDLYDEMVRKNIACTQHTYNTIICGLCKSGRTSQAREKLKIFINERNFHPSLMTYSSILDGLVKEGDMDNALSMYNEISEKGFSPDVITCTILIDGFCKSDNLDRAWDIRNEMKNKGIKLDLTAYGAIIDGFCKRMEMENACKIFHELRETGLFPNVFIYNSIISGYRNSNNMEKALSFHEKMIEDGISCDKETYTTLIDGLLREGKLKMASDFYGEMLEKGIQPDVIAYTVLVYGLCNKGELENARMLFDEVEEKGMCCNALMFNALVAGYFKLGNLPEAYRLYDVMIERGIPPDNRALDFLMNGKLRREDTSEGLLYTFLQLRKAAINNKNTLRVN